MHPFPPDRRSASSSRAVWSAVAIALALSCCAGCVAVPQPAQDAAAAGRQSPAPEMAGQRRALPAWLRSHRETGHGFRGAARTPLPGTAAPNPPAVTTTAPAAAPAAPATAPAAALADSRPLPSVHQLPPARKSDATEMEEYQAELAARRASAVRYAGGPELPAGHPPQVSRQPFVPGSVVSDGAAIRLTGYSDGPGPMQRADTGVPAGAGFGNPADPWNQDDADPRLAVPHPNRHPAGPPQYTGHYTQPPLVTGQELFPDQITATQQALALQERNARLLAEIQRMQSVTADLNRRLDAAHQEISLLSQQRDTLEMTVRSEVARSEQLQLQLADVRRENAALIEQSRMLVAAVEQTLDEILFNQLAPGEGTQPAATGPSR